MCYFYMYFRLKEVLMREAQLISTASPCDANLFQDGPETLDEVASIGRSLCPHFGTCDKSGFLGQHQCVMLLGLQAAQASLQQEISVAAVMEAYSNDIPRPVEGFVYSADRKTFTVIPRAEALVKIAEFARTVIGGSDGPQDNPCVAEQPLAPRFVSHMRNGPSAPRRDAVEEFLTNL
ncbi:MAG: hypothetical protein Q8N81_02840 [bacterium]|nr:hypothetical protein [bacterium]